MYASDRYWPIVVVKLPSVPSDDDYRCAAEELGTIFDTRSGKFIVLVDSLEMTAAPNVRQRKILNDFAASRHEMTLSRGLGTGFAIRSKIIRATLTAMDWLYRRPTPTGHLPTLTDTIEWCFERLEEADVSPPLLSAADLLRDSGAMEAAPERRSLG